MKCNLQPDGRWHFRADFEVTVYTKGAGTVRYQWGRGGGDIRSDVRTYNIDKSYADDTIHVWLTDSIGGSAPSPTDTVTDRLYPPGPNGLVVVEMTSKICP